MFGEKGRLGLIVPANNSVIEPEFWSVMPDGAAAFGTRLFVRGDISPEVVRKMETQVDRAVDELTATGVDVLVYADMATTFVMQTDWNETKTKEIADRAGVPCISAWTALRDALAVFDVTAFALGTPYPAPVHALTRPFFESNGYTVVDDATLGIAAMLDVPKVTPKRLKELVHRLETAGAGAIVLLATDLPTFASIEEIEAETGLPVLSSNQTLLWSALRAAGNNVAIKSLGRLFGN
jgi:maleate isomerase